MLQWFADNWGTVAVGRAVLALAAAAVLTLRKDKKQGKHSCGGNCGCCPAACNCHKQN